MNGSIDLKDAATQVALVAAIVAMIRPLVEKYVPQDLRDWALLSINGLLQAVIVFGTLLASSGAISLQSVLSAAGQAFTLMVLTHGGVDALNRAKKAATKDSADSAPVADATQNGLPLDPSQMGA